MTLFLSPSSLSLSLSVCLYVGTCIVVVCDLILLVCSIGACVGRGFALFTNEFIHIHPPIDPGSWAVIGTTHFL